MLHNTQHHKDMVRQKQKASEKKICFAITIPLLQSIYNSYFIQNLFPSVANRNAMQTHLCLPSLRFTVHTDCLTPVEKKKTLEAFVPDTINSTINDASLRF